MENQPLYDLVCVGNYTKDTIITPSGVRYVDGGAMNYSAHAANQLGRKIAVVTRLSIEDKRVVDKFIASGIDCYPTYTPKSTTMCLEYPTNDPDKRNLSVASTAGSITSKEIEHLNAKSAVIGTSFRGEVGNDVIQCFKSKNVFLAVDMQGFARVLLGEKLEYKPWGEMNNILPYIDVLKCDAVEARSLTGESNFYRAAEIFFRMGAKEVVLSHKDGILLLADGKFTAIDFFPENLTGRSGRGDTCIGSYMAMRISLDPCESLIWAAAVTSLKMGKLGPFDRSLADVEQFIEKHYNHKN